MKTKINIAISQNDEDRFNLVISKSSKTEDDTEIRENLIKSGITLEELKQYINEL